MKNVRLLEKAIKEDCEIKGFYINENDCTCVIGKLALVAGVPSRTLRTAGGTSIDVSDCDDDHPQCKINAVIKMRRAIHKKFGLTIEQQAAIQYRNDRNLTPAQRRQDILEYLCTQKA